MFLTLLDMFMRCALCNLQSRLVENTATVEREASEVTRAGSQVTLLAVYTILEIIEIISRSDAPHSPRGC